MLVYFSSNLYECLYYLNGCGFHDCQSLVSSDDINNLIPPHRNNENEISVISKEGIFGQDNQ